jgi:hypothetical protein
VLLPLHDLGLGGRLEAYSPPPQQTRLFNFGPRSGADTTRASGQRGLALTVSGRVGRIVSERGARTPVTLAMVSPLALTRHEREIAASFLKACPTGCR